MQMKSENVELLDCTVRDGGYFNDWKFGNAKLNSIVQRLINANVDYIELGFLDDRRQFDIDRSIYPDTDSVAKIFSSIKKNKHTLFLSMIDFGTCKIENIKPAKDSFIDGIRVIFKQGKMHEALAFCKQVKDLGYKVFTQLVSSTTYSDDAFNELIKLENDLKPYAVSIVDTYGLMDSKEAIHIYQKLDSGLDKSIRIGFHAHNNLQLAFSNCCSIFNLNTDRKTLFDGTLFGMGKSAGNCPTELLVDLLNENAKKKYIKNEILEAIVNEILPYNNNIKWGYSLKFYLAASNKVHPNYVSNLFAMRTLSISDTNNILGELKGEKALLFDKNYLEEVYKKYYINYLSDTDSVSKISNLLFTHNILLLGPGHSLAGEKSKIESCIRKKHPIIISLNMLYKDIKPDFIFVTNPQRYSQLITDFEYIKKNKIKLILTSNCKPLNNNVDFVVDFSTYISKDSPVFDNSLVILLNLMKRCFAKDVFLAGFDGYNTTTHDDYFNPDMAHPEIYSLSNSLNNYVSNFIQNLRSNMNISFVTTSFYDSTNDM